MDEEKSIVKTLELKGWTRHFMAKEPRLSKAVQMYRETGFEIHLKPLPPQPRRPSGKEYKLDADCRQCFEGFEDQYKIIFTRPGEDNSDRLEDDLF